MKSLFQEAIMLLKEKKSFSFATIINQDGSAPRSAGSKMLILPERIVETIGGGAMEADVIRQARESVYTNHEPIIKFYDLSPNEAANSGFICGGNCEVLIAYIDGQNSNNLKVFTEAQKAEIEGKKAWFVYVVNISENAIHPFQLCLSVKGEGLIGDFYGSEKFRENLIFNPIRIAIHGETQDGVRYIVDPIHTGGTMYLFGGGHVSLEVAKLAKRLEFRVVVIDDREEYANAKRFEDCEAVVIDDFNHIPEFSINGNSYILIITRGHLHDKTVLSWALSKEPFYIGMIGSLSKRDTIYQKLEEVGYEKKCLEKVHSPIGLAIGAETPAEIAISIMAEIIKERTKKE
ncbi:XdhC family aldehyde oxidoreductase maturation factor [Lachnotalea glycerini]|uniref:XdhC/CoxI family protein n=1 Tax=Lachnotalea glycerini TaxID=1763509 RepID=A0A371JGG0_9FIRM|nr:XdhC/CoxI family protein [Lachnotalea glycerini]RDY31834.1 XdhC/CoxI family protein [Lachnotalea glycerini]